LGTVCYNGLGNLKVGKEITSAQDMPSLQWDYGFEMWNSKNHVLLKTFNYMPSLHWDYGFEIWNSKNHALLKTFNCFNLWICILEIVKNYDFDAFKRRTILYQFNIW
jgi:hypothetical protein